jgi:hypothetical protein
MADPLSIAASVIALTKATQTCVTLLVDLVKCVRNVPAEIQALSNEVVDLKVVFDNFQELFENIDADNSQQSRVLKDAYLLLESARAALSELEGLLEKSNAQSFGAKERLKWILRHRKPARELQERFQRIRTELLGVSTLATLAAT